MSIASEIQRLQLAKQNIRTAIQNKGVAVPSSATLSEYPELIEAISAGTILRCIYNGTPFADIYSAFTNDDRMPVCFYGNKLYIMQSITSTEVQFGVLMDGTDYWIKCNSSNVWTNGENEIQVYTAVFG